MRDGLKIFRDPIYDLVYFDKEKDKPILKIIDTDEFQRLRRIRQLGLSSYTYSSTNHDRFTHSIGVCFIAGMLVDNLNFDEAYAEEIEGEIVLNREETTLLIKLAAILHDIGHGPFSHAFERAIKKNVEGSIPPGLQIHEHYSIKIIQSDAIRSIVESIDCKNVDSEKFKKYGVKWITEIIRGSFTGSKWIKEIISSQFDADRIDYLLRDAFMSGVKYAGFDWVWIFKNMFIGDVPMDNGETRKGILIDGNKGIHSLESFIVSRYHMYEQLYFHKTTRGFEAVINSIFNRLSLLIEKAVITSSDFLGDYFIEFLNGYNSLENYLQLDDYYMISHFNHWSKYCSDEILKELCNCFVNRIPFKMIKVFSSKNDGLAESYKEYSKLTEKYKKILGEKFEYYFLEDDYKNNPYKDEYLLSKPKTSERIWLSIRNEAKDLAEESSIINSLRNNVLEVNRIYVHRKFVDN